MSSVPRVKRQRVEGEEEEGRNDRYRMEVDLNENGGNRDDEINEGIRAQYERGEYEVQDERIVVEGVVVQNDLNQVEREERNGNGYAPDENDVNEVRRREFERNRNEIDEHVAHNEEVNENVGGQGDSSAYASSEIGSDENESHASVVGDDETVESGSTENDVISIEEVENISAENETDEASDEQVSENEMIEHTSREYGSSELGSDEYGSHELVSENDEADVVDDGAEQVAVVDRDAGWVAADNDNAERNVAGNDNAVGVAAGDGNAELVAAGDGNAERVAAGDDVEQFVVDDQEDYLLTDEEAEIEDEGPLRPLFQGIREDAGLSIPVTSREGLTDMDHLLVTLAMGIRFGWTYENIMFQLSWTKDCLENSNLPITKDKLWKLLGRDKQNMVCRLYCSECKEKIAHGNKPTRQCSCLRCGPGQAETYVDTYIQVRLRPQLEELLNLPNMEEALRYKFTREKINPDAIEDIYDGEMYKSLDREGEFLSNPFNYSLTLWTDGVKLTHSSRASAYPILLQVNELHPHARKKHLILAGIWVGRGGPASLSIIMQPVVRDVQFVNNEGVHRVLANGAMMISRFIVILFTADSIAKCNACRMKQFNGKCGCPTCLAPGILIQRNLRVYPALPFTLRTDDGIRRDGAIAYHTGTAVNGVKGCSALAGLPQFDLVDSVAIDDCHMGYEGVAKQWFTRIVTDVGEPYYIGRPAIMTNIDQRLLEIKTPSRISRTPRTVTMFSQWKGSEWRNWVMYYSLPCLNGILPPAYLQHWRKFVQLMFILDKFSISAADLEEAENLVENFIEEFQRLFGHRNMSFNLHLLRHTPACVRNWGPLWAYSTFPFESFNHEIVEAVTSPHHRADQIITRFLMKKFIIVTMGEVEIAEQTEIAIKNLLDASRVFVPNGMSPGHYFVGEGEVKVRLPSEQQIRLIRNAGFPITAETELTLYTKATSHGSKYRVVDDIDRKTCDFVVYSRSGFFKISKLLRFVDEGITFCGLIGKK